MIPCHEHNRRLGAPKQSGNFGIRMKLPGGDPMSSLLGADWQATQWFETHGEREKRLAELMDQFVYYRKGDRASLIYERVDQ
jgi:hypothetical protein